MANDYKLNVLIGFLAVAIVVFFLFKAFGGKNSSSKTKLGSSSANTYYGREKYLTKQETAKNAYMNDVNYPSPSSGVVSSKDDDRFNRAFLGSYIPFDDVNYTDEFRMTKPGAYGFGVSDERESAPLSFKKNDREMNRKRDELYDPFSDVLIDEPRDLTTFDEVFEKTYLTSKKGQSHDLREDIPPKLNMKFMNTGNEDDYDCLVGAKLHSRGPLLIDKPIRMYVY